MSPRCKRSLTSSFVIALKFALSLKQFRCSFQASWSLWKAEIYEALNSTEFSYQVIWECPLYGFKMTFFMTLRVHWLSIVFHFFIIIEIFHQKFFCGPCCRNWLLCNFKINVNDRKTNLNDQTKNFVGITKNFSTHFSPPLSHYL